MTATILADEHIKKGIVKNPNSEFQIEYVVDVLSPSVDDDEILDAAREHGCLILTNDKGFLKVDLSNENTGILYLPNVRLDGYTIGKILYEIEYHCQSIDELYGEVTFVTHDWLPES